MFDIRTINLDAGFYLRMEPEKSLSKVYKYKKDKYLRDWLECRNYLTPVVYSAEGIPRAEALET